MGSPHIGFQAPVQDQEGQNGRAGEQTWCFFSQENGQVKMKIDLYIYISYIIYIIYILFIYIYIIYIIYIIYGCFLKCGTPKTPPKSSFLVGTPMVVGYHHFRKPPYIPENED